MKTSFEKLNVPIGVDFPYPVDIGALRSVESQVVVGNNVVMTIVVDKEVIPARCGIMFIKLSSGVTSPYARFGRVNPNLLGTSNCIGQMDSPIA